MATVFLMFASARAEGPPPATVESVDLSRYVGLWYEVAKIPNRFQRQCARAVTAEYTLRPDGRIDVLNRCMQADGTASEARGIAKVVDRTTNAKLEVRFVRFLGLQLFWGDYWILGLGANYEYAVIGTPNRKYGWILSRTPIIDPATRDAAFATLRAQGYDPADFKMTAH
jgi:apolipoprotein D and lipocalin family protein